MGYAEPSGDELIAKINAAIAQITNTKIDTIVTDSELAGHTGKQADPADTDAVREKHVSNNDMKLNADHRGAAAPHSGHAPKTRASNTGSFMGDGSTNRGIAHGLGLKPSKVVFYDSINATIEMMEITSGTPGCRTHHLENNGITDVTVWDTTNFYVTGTEGGNRSGYTIYWKAYA